MTKNRTTIRDVAAAAGVSITTVSHVLNGKGRIDAATAKKVREVAGRLGYRASHVARNLRDGLTGRIAIITSPSHKVSLTDLAFFIRLLTAAAEHAAERGFSILLMLPESSDDTASIGIDGVILVDPANAEPLLPILRKHAVPVVTIGRDPADKSSKTSWVDNDLHAATLAMLDHLAGRGARRIGLITSSPHFSYSADAIEAYRAWAARQRQPEIILQVDDSLRETDAFFAARTIFEQSTTPDALHCTTDRLAIGVLLAAAAANVAVPDDLMVTAGTDSDLAARATPPLTALDLDPESIGRTASAMLIDRIEGRAVSRSETIPFKLVVRNST